ncbi:MAG: hypothetical protein V4850_03240 [Myxococcota bacterium]
MLLALAACTASPDDDSGTPAAPTTLEWLYGAVEAPPDDQIVGRIQVSHSARIYGPEPSFSGEAYFWEPGWAGWVQAWVDPFDGLGDCGVWTEPPVYEGEPTWSSAGTVFLDAGLDRPLPLAPIDGLYRGAYFSDEDWGPVPFGATFAVAAVGDEVPAFTFDPAFVLPAAAMIVTSPVDPDGSDPASVAAGALPVTWEGADPYATVVIEISSDQDAGAYCEVPDTGAFTVPAAAMATVGGERLSLSVTRALTRYGTLAPDRHVMLRTSSYTSLSLSVE